MPTTPSPPPVPTTPSSPPVPGIRPVVDSDAPSLIELVGSAYAEYPGCVMDLPGIDEDLTTPASAAAARGGRWWVVESRERIIASIGAGAVRDDGHLELKRLYLDQAARGRGIASALIQRVEAHAAGLGAIAVDLWSDTRFRDAHHRYQQLGYADTGEHRQLHDPSNTTEFRFVKPLSPLAARHQVTWNGPDGLDRCALTSLPDGTLLRGEVADTHYEVELDAHWRTRRAEVRTGAKVRTGVTGLRLSSDGAGRWWRDGRPAEWLGGCLDVDLDLTPATNLLPIRRLCPPVGGVVDVTAAWVRSAAATIEPVDQRYERTGATTWRYASGGFEATIEVDDDGLPVAYVSASGDQLWTRAG